jgi:hypothetical protein
VAAEPKKILPIIARYFFILIAGLFVIHHPGGLPRHLAAVKI